MVNQHRLAAQDLLCGLNFAVNGLLRAARAEQGLRYQGFLPATAQDSAPGWLRSPSWSQSSSPLFRILTQSTPPALPAFQQRCIEYAPGACQYQAPGLV